MDNGGAVRFVLDPCALWTGEGISARKKRRFLCISIVCPAVAKEQRLKFVVLTFISWVSRLVEVGHTFPRVGDVETSQ